MDAHTRTLALCSALFVTATAVGMPGCGGLLTVPSNPTNTKPGDVCRSDDNCAKPMTCVEGVCVMPTFCSPLALNGYCPKPTQRCSNGVCVDEATVTVRCVDGCTGQACDAAGDCVAIATDTACSKANPGGLCLFPGICNNGVCYSPADPTVDKSIFCSPTNTTGLCQLGTICGSSGACVLGSETPCSPGNTAGYCAGLKVCTSSGACEIPPCSLAHTYGLCDPTTYCSVVGECVDDGYCGATGDCDRTYYCDDTQKVCIRDYHCQTTPDCLEFEFCSQTGVCIIVGDCLDNLDCTNGGICGSNGKCLAPGACLTTTDCTGGKFCSSLKTCLNPGECIRAIDCPPGHACATGACVLSGTSCTANAPYWSTCPSGPSDPPGCCPAGQTCCAGNQRCSTAGSCIAMGECVSGADCFTGFSCVGYKCVPNDHSDPCPIGEKATVLNGCMAETATKDAVTLNACAVTNDCNGVEMCSPFFQCVPGANCGSSTYATTAITPNMLIVLDRSGSMNTIVSGTDTRWMQAVSAVNAVASQYGAQIRFGLSTFANVSGTCAAGLVDVPISDSSAGIPTSLAGTSAGSNTPTHETMSAILANRNGYGLPSASETLPRDNFVLLVTDGEANCTGSAALVTSDLAALAALSPPIKTYVVGFAFATVSANLTCAAVAGGESQCGAGVTTSNCATYCSSAATSTACGGLGATCAWSSVACSTYTSSTTCTARAGCTWNTNNNPKCSGTTSACDFAKTCYYQASNVTELTTHFADIAKQVVGCSYSLGANVPLDLNSMYIYLDYTSPVSTVRLAPSDWVYVPPPSNRIDIVGAKCADIEAGLAAPRVIYGCPTGGG